MPYEWFLSEICAVFSCLPSQARQELEADPFRTVIKVMQLRAYADTKRAFDRRIAGDQTVQLVAGRALDLVKQHTERFVLEEKARGRR